MASVSFKGLKKRYGDVEVVKGFDLEINDGEFIVLLGPSGCGKSTTLRMLAGLEDISDGDILIDDSVVNDLHPIDRNIAMVFQSYALYPHMTVKDNIGFSLKMTGVKKDQIEKRVMEVASMLELIPLLDRKPKALSGGQRQRVAMGRAMVRTPDVFLFDEPLSNLDAKLRGQMRKEIRDLHYKLKTTTIYVTHDQVEAMSLADRIVILNNGYVEQVGSPKEIFEKPANKFVASFIGSPEMNLLSLSGEHLQGFDFNCINPVVLETEEAFNLGIRPSDLKVNEKTIPEAHRKYIDVALNSSELLGANYHLFCTYLGHSIVAEVPLSDLTEDTHSLRLYFDQRKIHLFDKTDKSILKVA